MILVSHNVDKFRAAVDQFSRNFGVAVAPVLHEQMALWAKDCAKKFPPSTEFGSSSYGKYQRMVDSQVRLVVVPENVGKRASKPVTVGGEQFQLIVKTDGKVRFIPKALWRPDATAADVEQYVNTFRGEDGHVSGKKVLAAWNKPVRSAVYGGKSSKRVKRGAKLPIDYRMHTAKGSIDAAIKTKKSHIGKLKSGWLDGMYHWAFLANKNVTIRDKWVGRHHGYNYGSFSGAIDQRGKGTIVSTNNIPWAHRFKRIVDGTVPTRVKDLKRWLAVRMGLELERLGLSRRTRRAA